MDPLLTEIARRPLSKLAWDYRRTVRKYVEESVEEKTEDPFAVGIPDGNVTLVFRLVQVVPRRIFRGRHVTIVREYPVTGSLTRR